MKKALNTPHEWSEDRLQQEFYLWFNNRFPSYRGLLFSIPNGGIRDAITARKMKYTGLFPGVADMFFMFGGKTYLIELKRPDGKNDQSSAQKYWQEKIESQGFEYRLFNDLEELKKFICSII